MKKILASLSVLCLAVILSADVTEKTKVRITFGELGTLTSSSTGYYKGLLKKDDSEGEFKSAGFMGKMVGAFFPEGKQGQLFNLPEKMQYALNYEEKEYKKIKIEKIEMEKSASGSAESGESEKDSRYKTIRNELKVIETGNKKKLNQFDVKEFNIIIVNEVEEIATKIRQTDSMKIVLWNTDKTADFTKAAAEKLTFNKELFKLMGMADIQSEYSDILGTSWLSMFKSISKESAKQDNKIDYKAFSKLSGYPVVIDGHMLSKKVDPAQKNQSADDDVPSGMGGLLGSMLSKSTKSAEKADAFKESFAYYIEIESINFDNLGDDVFKIPAGFEED